MTALLFICLLIIFLADCEGYLTVTLKNVTANLGTEIVIPSTYMTDIVEIFPIIVWSAYSNKNIETRLYKYFVDPSDGNSCKNYFLERNLWVDQGSLVIPNVTIDDEKNFARLQCEVDF